MDLFPTSLFFFVFLRALCGELLFLRVSPGKEVVVIDAPAVGLVAILPGPSAPKNARAHGWNSSNRSWTGLSLFGSTSLRSRSFQRLEQNLHLLLIVMRNRPFTAGVQMGLNGFGCRMG